MPRPTLGGNKESFAKHADAYRTLELMPPERRLLTCLSHRWSQVDMLDLGVGAGRTAWTFAPLARSYVGLDYLERMVELARQNVGEDDSTRFVLGDARDLSDFEDGSFDVVMFSFNGIDSIGHEDRLKALSEARRVTRHDGVFFFSTHSLRALPWRHELTLPRLDHPFESTIQSIASVRKTIQLYRSNRELDREAIRRDGWALVWDAGHDFQVRIYYVMPEHQLEQLAEAGFAAEEVLDMAGRPVDPHDPRSPGQDLWLHYLCRPH